MSDLYDEHGKPNWAILVAVMAIIAVVCVAAGTRIVPARGAVAVEALRIGALVATAQGAEAPLQPIAWIGRLHLDLRRESDRVATAPVLVKAGALAEGVPHRDLRVSPEHALLIDGHLVPAGLLVNGRSIVQELWRSDVTYWHVELPSHAVLLAEGAPAESYLDCGNRQFFDNGRIRALFPATALTHDPGRYDAEACRPVLRAGSRLEAIRDRIGQRADDTARARRGRATGA